MSFIVIVLSVCFLNRCFIVVVSNFMIIVGGFFSFCSCVMSFFIALNASNMKSFWSRCLSFIMSCIIVVRFSFVLCGMFWIVTSSVGFGVLSVVFLLWIGGWMDGMDGCMDGWMVNGWVG